MAWLVLGYTFYDVIFRVRIGGGPVGSLGSDDISPLYGCFWGSPAFLGGLTIFFRGSLVFLEGALIFRRMMFVCMHVDLCGYVNL